MAPSLAVSFSRTTQAWVPSPALSLTSCVTCNSCFPSLRVHCLIPERKQRGHSCASDHDAGPRGLPSEDLFCRPVTLLQLWDLKEWLYVEHLEKGVGVTSSSHLLSSLTGTDQQKSRCLPSRAWASSHQEPCGRQGKHGVPRLSAIPLHTTHSQQSSVFTAPQARKRTKQQQRGRGSDHPVPAILSVKDKPGPGRGSHSKEAKALLERRIYSR